MSEGEVGVRTTIVWITARPSKCIIIIIIIIMDHGRYDQGHASGFERSE
jgi:hypothetical protein